MTSVPARALLVVSIALCGLFEGSFVGTAQNAPAPAAPPKAAAAPAAAQGGDVVTLDRAMVVLNATVTDSNGRLVSGLERASFDVYEDKVRQRIEFFKDADAPVTLGIVYDVSASMRYHHTSALAALRRVVETGSVDDQYFVVTFNQRPQLVRDFTPSGESVVSGLTYVSPDGRTALYDALYLAVEKAREGGREKRAILVISDGQDNSSRYRFEELRDRLKESDVIVYAIGIADPLGYDQLVGYGMAVLDEITGVTGGRAFYPTNDDELDDACSQVALELRHQYSIGYYPSSDVRDGRWHKIKVKLTPPRGRGRLAVRAKEGYFGLAR